MSGQVFFARDKSHYCPSKDILKSAGFYYKKEKDCRIKDYYSFQIQPVSTTRLSAYAYPLFRVLKIS